MNTILHLDRNENLYGPAPKCFDVLRNITEEELSVYSRDFARGVKSKLSERLAADFGIPENQILLSEGSEDMLKQAVHCYLKPGEIILVPEQSWWYYQKVAEEVSGVTVNYVLRENGEAYFYDVDDIKALCRKNQPRVVLIASPNNPTGNSFPDQTFEMLLASVGEAVVILDEAYWGFNGQTNDHIGSLVERHENLLILRTFSKYFALAGTRIGFAAAGKGLSHLARFASRYLGFNRVSEALALAALDSPSHYSQISENMKADREKYCELFARFEGLQCFKSDANFVLVRIPPELKSPIQQYLTHNDIAVKFFSEPEFTSHMRITLGTVNQNRKLLKLLDEFLRVWKTHGVPA
ncbi:MAG: aminotransferase class I/II-fold pyridoxal phosphate-dependent enzyme [Ignavibacteriales bacterium]|nr:aminotransferase class I/II-fold pyridoxal phosphate-dependent enzyme [Ignavibacteriales bacterium]